MAQHVVFQEISQDAMSAGITMLAGSTAKLIRSRPNQLLLRYPSKNELMKASVR